MLRNSVLNGSRQYLITERRKLEEVGVCLHFSNHDRESLPGRISTIGPQENLDGFYKQ
jgi:hypothetical protein